MKKIFAMVLFVTLMFTVFTTGCGDTVCRHKYGEWVVTQETCISGGVKERECSLCGNVETETFKGGEHNKYSAWWEDENKHYRICRTCGERFDVGEHVYVGGVCKCGKKEIIVTVWDIPDYIVEIEEGRDVRVLFLADTQIIDATQARTPERAGQLDGRWIPENNEDLCFKYIRRAVETANPDLIILVGDNVYGEFDDNGTSLTQLIEVMDSFGIPWGLVNGNHDNESAKGAKWQNKQYENAEHCLFKKGDTDGNGNYTIAIKQGNKIVRMFYLMDSNYCSGASNPAYNEVITSLGFTQNQVEWMYNRMERLEQLNGGSVNSTLCFHVATSEYGLAWNKYSTDPTRQFTLNKAGSPVAQDGDFGSFPGYTRGNFDTYIVPSAYNMSFLDICKKYSVDTAFCGHSHKVNTSILYEGIRWTFCLKTGEFDNHTADELGGTQMLFNSYSFSVKHLYHNPAKQAEYDALRN